MEQVSSNVWVETGFRGCNPGFVSTKQGVVMIDAPWRPSDALKWRDEVTRRGEVRYLINTEPHPDHFSGDFFFPAPVVSHRGTRERLAQVTADEVTQTMTNIDPQGLALSEGYQVRLPTITFSNWVTLHLGEHTFELLHLPGHTPSQIAVFIPGEGVVFTGDNVSGKVQTFLHEADPEQWLESLNRIAELEVDVVVPGHGQVCPRSYLAEQASYIREWVTAVRGAIEKGLSEEETIQSLSYFIDRYPFDVGSEDLADLFLPWNVGRLYPLLRASAG